LDLSAFFRDNVEDGSLNAETEATLHLSDDIKASLGAKYDSKDGASASASISIPL
jgi:hypothetical protein